MKCKLNQFACRNVIVAVAVLMWSITANGATVSYDLAEQWSDIANPNGAWSYNQNGIPLLHHQDNWSNISGLNGWTTTPTGVVPPGWFISSIGFDGSDAGDIVVHSTSGDGLLADVTWTSPSAGVIDISGQAWDVIHFADRDDAWTLLLNDIVLATAFSVLGVSKDSAAADFTSNLLAGQSLTGLSVNAGDVVTFQIQNSGFSDFGHFTGVDLTVKLAPIPVPSAVWLFGSALAGIGVFRRK